MFDEWVDKIQTMIVEKVQVIPCVPYFADIFINKLYEVVLLLHYKFIGVRRKRVQGFNKRRYRKLRERLKSKRKSALPAIREAPARELIANSEEFDPDIEFSCSDHVLNCLASGWTIKQTFGLKPRPKGIPKEGNRYLMERIFMKHDWRRTRPRRKLDFKAVITEFLTDQVVFCDSCRSVGINKTN